MKNFLMKVGEKIRQVRDFLKGKKTYILMALGAVTIITGWADGELTTKQAIIDLLGAGGLSTLRASKGQPK